MVSLIIEVMSVLEALALFMYDADTLTSTPSIGAEAETELWMARSNSLCVSIL